MDLDRPRRAQALDGSSRGSPPDDGVIDRDEPLALDRARQRVQLEHHARLAQGLVGLDEGAVDVAALHQRLAERDARRFGIADRGRRAGVRERDDHVRLDRRLLSQLVAHADTRVLQLAVLEYGIGPGEVDELEDAHRVLARGLEVDASHSILVHEHHLARLDLAHEGCPYRVECAGLRGHDVRRLSRERDVADAQRPEAIRVAQRDQLVGRDDAARVRAHDARERAPDDVFPGLAMGALDESGHYLGIERGLECHALVAELCPQRCRIEQIPVMCDRARSEQRMVERNRVGVLGSA